MSVKKVKQEESKDKHLSDEVESGGNSSDDEDASAHAKLLSDMQSITKKDRRKMSEGRVRCATAGGTGVDLGALHLLTKTIPRTDLKEAAPSSKPHEKRVNRHRGYKEVAEDVNKWQGVVKEQREARQLVFPLKDNHVSLIDQDKQFKPRMKNDMERELYELMSQADMIKPKVETDEERAVREAMSLEEVQERNRESWRLKVLRDKIGKKAHLRNKTKSKKFHRVLKKDRLKQQAARLEQLQKDDPEKALEKLKEFDDIRIEERMTQKHKKSKWAKSLQLRAKTDKNALAALQENSRLHQELVQKLKKDGDEDGSSSSSEDSSSDEEPQKEAETLNATPAPGVVNQSYIKMKQFWGEYNKQREEEVKDQLQQLREKRKQPSKGKHQQTIEEAEKIIKEKLASATANDSDGSSDGDQRPKITKYEFTFNTNDRPDNAMDEGSQRMTTLEDFDNMPSQKEKVVNPAELNFARENPPAKRKDLVEIDDTKTQALTTKVLDCGRANGIDLFNDDSDDEDADRNIFDDEDNALEQFNKEKREAEEAAAPKDVCYALPGWGDWTGPGIEISKSKKKRFTEKAPKKAPSKFDKQNVIYDEKADLHQNIRNRMVSVLPFPFLNVSDWEASIRGPVGRAFVPESVHRELIKPSLKTNVGSVIKPMDKSALIERPEVQEAVMRKLKRSLDEGTGPESKKTKNRGRQKAGDRVLQLGDSKKKKFTRKSVKTMT